MTMNQQRDERKRKQTQENTFFHEIFHSPQEHVVGGARIHERVGHDQRRATDRAALHAVLQGRVGREKVTVNL